MLNEKDAYKAMILFLEKYYLISKSDDIGGLLGSMMLLDDGKPADSAMWEDWIESVKKYVKNHSNNDQIKTITNGNGMETSYEYDRNNRIIEESYAIGGVNFSQSR